MHEYIHVFIRHPHEHVILDRPIMLRGGVFEIGVLHLELPERIGNIDSKSDYVKYLDRKRTHTLRRMHTLLKPGKPLTETFKYGMRYKPGLKMAFTQEGGRYHLTLPPGWALKISPRLAGLVKMPEYLNAESTYGQEGAKRLYEGHRNTSEYFYFFRFAWRTRHLRLPTGNYASKQAIRTRLKEMGLSDGGGSGGDDVEQQAPRMSASLKEKMKKFLKGDFIAISCDLVANKTHIGAREEPLLILASSESRITEPREIHSHHGAS